MHDRSSVQLDSTKPLDSFSFCSWKGWGGGDLSGTFPWAPGIWTPVPSLAICRTDPVTSLAAAKPCPSGKLDSERGPSGLVAPSGCSLSLSGAQCRIFYLYRHHFPVFSFPTGLVLGLEPLDSLSTPLILILLSDFSPRLLNGRLGGRDCFGWNLTRHRWFYQLQVL